jgi:type III secretion system FlhB-like substrate exporter
MNGHVLDHAKKMNIPLPYTALTVETILKIDAKEIIPDKENIYSIIQSIK